MKNKVGRPPEHKPKLPVISIRDVDPDIYLRFKIRAMRHRQTIGEALTALMRQRLKEIGAEEFETKVEAIRGR